MKTKTTLVFICGLILGFMSSLPFLQRAIQKSTFEGFYNQIVEMNTTIRLVENGKTEVLATLQKPLVKIFLCDLHYLEKEYFWIDNNTIANDTRINKIMNDTKFDLKQCPELARTKVEA